MRRGDARARYQRAGYYMGVNVCVKTRRDEKEERRVVRGEGRVCEEQAGAGSADLLIVDAWLTPRAAWA